MKVKKFIKKLIGKFVKEENSHVDFNVQSKKIEMHEFITLEVVSDYIKSNKKKATILNPRKYHKYISQSSFMGGNPNLSNHLSYPLCDCCSMPLNFVLQFTKNDYSEFYWPKNKTIFQLFRCPNYDCEETLSEKYDLKMFHFYFESSPSENDNIKKPFVKITNCEQEVKECIFKSEKIDDYNEFYIVNEKAFKTLETKYGDEIVEEFNDNYLPKQRTKIGGYPSFTQNVFYPSCECGKTKYFFFQLSSEDNGRINDSDEFTGEDVWSHHGIMIGDVGNIYYYVCEDCGEKSIESYWDCF